MTTETSTTDSRHRAWSMMAGPVEAGSEAATQPLGEADARAGTARPRLVGLRCRGCGRPEEIGPSFVCPECFGPLEVVCDHEAIRSQVSRDVIAARPANIWRYLELLPIDAEPARSLHVGFTPLLRADRLAAEIGLPQGTLRLKDDTRNPTLSFKDR